jgi:sulfur transfer protein SufE
MTLSDLKPEVRVLVEKGMERLNAEMCARAADSLRRAANIMEQIPTGKDTEERFRLMIEAGEAINMAAEALGQAEEM